MNLFAEELQKILLALKPPATIGHLDDRSDPLTLKKVHKEKVRRLQQSLTMPIFPTLNPEEIDQVARAFHLLPPQHLRLRAAVLATAVEQTLSGRIVLEKALAAGREVLPLIEEAIRDHQNDNEGLGAAKGGFVIMSSPLPAEDDGQWLAALDAVDRGTLHLSMGMMAHSVVERIHSAQQAHSDFSEALHLLQRDMPAQSSDRWQYWWDEATQGQRQAEAMKQNT